MLRDYLTPLDTGYTPPPPPEPWATTALRAVAEVAAEGQPFTALNIWNKLEAWGVPEPKEPRAMGALMKRATSLGLCRSSGEYQSTQKGTSHAHPRRVYIP